MSTQKVAAWSHAEEFVTPSEQVEEAIHRGEELGAPAVGNGVGAALQMLAAATGATTGSATRWRPAPRSAPSRSTRRI